MCASNMKSASFDVLASRFSRLLSPAHDFLGGLTDGSCRRVIRCVTCSPAPTENEVGPLVRASAVATKGHRTKGKWPSPPSTERCRSKRSANDGSVVDHSAASFNHLVGPGQQRQPYVQA